MNITQHIDIDRPAEAVFAVVADYACDPQWRDGVATMRPSHPGPARAGTTTEEVIRFLGKTYVNPGRVVAVDGRCLRWEARSETLRAHGTREVTALGPGRARFTYTLEARMKGAAGPVDAVLGALFRRRVRADLRRLAALLTAAGERAAA